MSVVYLVHNIDTEGPLSEGHPGAARHAQKFPHIDVDFATADLADVIRQHRPRILGSWSDIAAMLDVATSEQNRMALKDSFGGGWVFNWFCMDHIGFTDNPRYRSMGVHHVFDFYADLIKSQKAGDALHWHFHPMSTYREANICATSYVNSPELYYLLGRRLLDRKWFPVANRPGFQDERPDAHWFLEQWIPFDFANAGGGYVDMKANPDLADGRFSDWRFAPTDWRTYHPSHDSVQMEGHCRRKIARSLTLLNRLNALTEAELEAAFKRAATGLPTLVSFESHDWRDLSVEMAYVRYLLGRIAPKYPQIRFKFSEAVEAFNAVHPPKAQAPLKLDCSLFFENGRPKRVNIEVPQGKVFGPQPFLVVRSRSKRIIHDNVNYWRSMADFNYIFDEQSIHPSDVDAIGIAANDDAGKQSIHVVTIDECSGETVKF